MSAKVNKERLHALGLHALAIRYETDPPKYLPTMSSPVYHTEYKNWDHDAVNPNIDKEQGKERKDCAKMICQTALSSLTAKTRTIMGLDLERNFTEQISHDLVDQGMNIALYGLKTYNPILVADYVTAVEDVLENWDRIPQEIWDGEEHREMLIACWLKAKNEGT